MANRIDVQSGVVIVDNTPYYYVDLIHGSDGDLIVAYELSKKSVKNYNQTRDPTLLAKANKGEYLKAQRFKTDTKSDLAKHLADKLGNKNDRKQLRFFYKAALFTAPVEYDTDSISGDYVKGFKEMNKTVITGPINGKYPRMKPTGVFIGLNNIKWLKDVYKFNQFNGYTMPIYENYTAYFNTIKMMGMI